MSQSKSVQNIVAIIQARMGSTRLPGKVMMNLAGSPMLQRCVNRVNRSKMVNKTVIATTDNKEDDIIEQFCISNNWFYYRGSVHDLLDRYYQSAVKHNADVIVRITSDCPFIDPEIIDLIVKELIENYPSLDFVSNCIGKYTFPRGLDVEVMTFTALQRAWKEDKNLAWREHVTPYIYFNQHKFRCKNIAYDADLSEMRWTVDTKEDFLFAKKIYNYFGHDLFSWQEVIKLLKKNPHWKLINKYVNQKTLNGV